jgi:hypothetical protein
MKDAFQSFWFSVNDLCNMFMVFWAGLSYGVYQLQEKDLSKDDLYDEVEAEVPRSEVIGLFKVFFISGTSVGSS